MKSTRESRSDTKTSAKGLVSNTCDSEPKISNALFVKTVQQNYSLYLKKCYAYVKCPSLAEDAVQEGILAAHLNLASIKDPNALSAWLYRIIIRKAIDLLHKHKKLSLFDDNLEALINYDKHDFLDAPMWAEVSNPEEEILKSEGLQQVAKAMKLLDDVYRIPILLKDFEGFSIREISEMLGISQSNTKVRIHRARVKLKIELNDYFFPTNMGELK